jgi:type VI protein secretion system component VasF
MSTTQAPDYSSAVRAMSQAAAESEQTHAPVRLAYWRIAALDTLLDRLEELRLANERVLPEDIREQVVTYASRHDAELADRLRRIDAEDLNAVHDAVFEAQGRVMLQLAELRRVPNWQDLDLILAPGDDEAA